MNDIQIAIKQNNFDRDTIPMFKSQLENSGVIASKQSIHKKIEANCSKEKLIPGTLMQNKEFAHVFLAMKQSTKELQNSIIDDYPVFFDTIPVMFDPIDPDEMVGWNVLKEKIYERKGGIRNLDLATTRMQENFSYMNQVNEAFTKGKKPPMRFSDEEKIVIAKMLKRMEIKKKRNVPHRNMTNINLLMKSNVRDLNKIA